MAAASSPMETATTLPLGRAAPRTIDGEELTADDPPPEVAERAAEVRRGGGDDGGGDRQCAGRERRRAVEVGEPRQAVPRAVAEQGGDEHGDQQRRRDAGDEVAGERPPATEQRDDEQHDAPRDWRPRQDEPQRIEEARQARQRVGDGDVEVAADLRERRREQEQDDAGDDQGDVRRPARSRLVLGRGEEQQPDWRVDGDSSRHGRIVRSPVLGAGDHASVAAMGQDGAMGESIGQQTEPEQASGGRARSIVAGVLGVLAILVLMVTTVAVWAKATAFNSEKVAGIVGDAHRRAGRAGGARRLHHHAGLHGRRRRCGVVVDPSRRARRGSSR